MSLNNENNLINAISKSNNQLQLSKENSKKILPYVAATCTSFSNDASWIAPFNFNLINPYKQGIKPKNAKILPHDNCFFDHETALKISVCEGKSSIIIAFGAMGSACTEVPSEKHEEYREKQKKNALWNLQGFSCPVYQEAAEFVGELCRLERFRSKQIVLVGQSLGGALAQFSGIWNQLPTMSFNPIPLGRAQIKILEGQFPNRNFSENILTVSSENDYATTLGTGYITKMFGLFVQTPKLYGIRYEIPSAYLDVIENHSYFMGSLMNYLGYDKRAKTTDLPQFEILKNLEIISKHNGSLELESILAMLKLLKTAINTHNSKDISSILNSLKYTHSELYDFLCLALWVGNEGKDLFDWKYGENRLLQNTSLLTKEFGNNVSLLDQLENHFHSLLNIENTKNRLSQIQKKLNHLNAELHILPYFSNISSLVNFFNPFQVSDQSVQNLDEGIASHALDFEQLKELSLSLVDSNSSQEKRLELLKKIESDNPTLYTSLYLSLKRHLEKKLNAKDLPVNFINNMLLSRPELLFEEVGSPIFHTMEMIKCLKDIEEMIKEFQPIKNALHVHSGLLPKSPVNSKNLSEKEKIPMWISQLEELEQLFGIATTAQHLDATLKTHLSSKLPISSKQLITPAKFQLAVIGKEEESTRHIYMVSAEYRGVIKPGGLGEAVRGLADGLLKSGRHVTLIMPKYDKFPQDSNNELFKSLELTTIKSQHIFGGVTKVDRVFRGFLNKIEILFIEDSPQSSNNNLVHDHFALGNSGLYDGEDAILKERFAYFGSAAAGLVYQLRKEMDIVFFHDWHGAMGIPLLAHRHTKEWIDNEIPPLVFVTHNMGYAAQGILDQHSCQNFMHKMHLPGTDFNITKECVSLADHICTVSEGYAMEVQGREGKGLEYDMRRIASQGLFTGITNGSNPNAFNPKESAVLKNWKDPFTKNPAPLNFGTDSDIIQAKDLIKVQLQKWLICYHPEIVAKFGIDLTKNNIILFIGRYDSSQKGISKLRYALHAAYNSGSTFICMGTGEDKKATELLNELEIEASKLKDPDKWGGTWIIRDTLEQDAEGKVVKVNYQNSANGVPGIGELVRASANILLVPSEYEPCGLVQLEGQAFGCMTVGSNIGGLADTIITDKTSDDFCGFLYERFDKWESEEQNEEISTTLLTAIEYYNSLKVDEKNNFAKKMMLRFAQSSWTTTISGLSPVQKYIAVSDAAKTQAKRRGLKFQPKLKLLTK